MWNARTAIACIAAIGIAMVFWVAAPSVAWAIAAGSEGAAAAAEPESAAIPAATYPPKTPAAPAKSAGASAATPPATAAATGGSSTTPAAKTPAELAADRRAAELAARQLAQTRASLAARQPKTEFQNASVKDALQVLSDAGRLSIVIDSALEEAGVDLAARTVSLRATGLSFEDALNLILPREAGFRVESGYVLVTTLEKSWLPLRLKTYSLKLATAEIPDFTNSPRLNIGQVISNGQGGQGGGGGLFGATPAAAITPETAGRATPERIIAMIKQLVRSAGDRRIAPWDDDGGPATIQQIGTQMVVMQTDAGQRAVARVLAAIE